MLHRFFLKVWLRNRKGNNGTQLYPKNNFDLSRIGAEGNGVMWMARTEYARCNVGAINEGDQLGGKDEEGAVGWERWSWCGWSCVYSREHTRPLIEVNGFLHFSRHLSIPTALQ